MLSFQKINEDDKNILLINQLWITLSDSLFQVLPEEDYEDEEKEEDEEEEEEDLTDFIDWTTDGSKKKAIKGFSDQVLKEIGETFSQLEEPSFSNWEANDLIKATTEWFTAEGRKRVSHPTDPERDGKVKLQHWKTANGPQQENHARVQIDGNQDHQNTDTILFVYGCESLQKDQQSKQTINQIFILSCVSNRDSIGSVGLRECSIVIGKLHWQGSMTERLIVRWRELPASIRIIFKKNDHFLKAKRTPVVGTLYLVVFPSLKCTTLFEGSFSARRW